MVETAIVYVGICKGFPIWIDPEWWMLVQRFINAEVLGRVFGITHITPLDFTLHYFWMHTRIRSCSYLVHGCVWQRITSHYPISTTLPVLNPGTLWTSALQRGLCKHVDPLATEDVKTVGAGKSWTSWPQTPIPIQSKNVWCARTRRSAMTTFLFVHTHNQYMHRCITWSVHDTHTLPFHVYVTHGT